MAANMTEIEELKKNINDVFLVTNGIIVCLMQCGFACLEAGAVRSKNTTNIVMQNVLDIFFSILSYWLVGYALAYGQGNSVFGYTFWAGSGLGPDLMAHWFFQFVFAATAATIVSGAVAERCNFITYITYSVVITGFIYPLVSRWAWAEGGWLKELGYQDFSGCGPVHLLAGVMSFVAAAFLGPRIGRFPKKDDDGPVEEIVGHSTALVGMGGMILITGFLSFNGGTLGTMTNPGDGATISKVVINTLMGGSGAAIIVLAGSRMGLFGAPCWSFTYTLNAALAGMVSTCGAVNTYAFWGSFVSGLTCGPIMMILHYVMLRLRIDDPLDAVAVHFGGGLWGLITASLFSEQGLVYGMTKESLTIFAYRMVGAATIIVWTAITGSIMFGALKYFGKLRVTPEEELAGLDISQHNEEGYPAEGWKKSPLQLTPQISVLPTSYLSQPVKDNVLFRGFRLHDENNGAAASHGLHNYIKRSGLRKHRASVDVSALTGL